MKKLMKNQIHTVTIDAYAEDASGVCRVEGCAVFVPQAIPGECWEIKILKAGKSYAYARGEELLSPSPFRVEPDCPVYGKCGGCDCRHLCYEEELRFKLAKVNDALSRIGKQTLRAEQILGSDQIEAYRNKGIFALGTLDGKAVSGFYRERSHQTIPVDFCRIQDDLSRRAAQAVTSFMNTNGIAAYDETNDCGVVRHIYCRRAMKRNGRMLCIVARRGFGAKTEALVSAIR